MGLAVLPDRLVSELNDLEMKMTAEDIAAQHQLSDNPDKFEYLLKVLKDMNLSANSEPREALRAAVGMVFTQGLEHCGVYDVSISGQMGVERFISRINSGV
jgi:galactose-1-phosphate uridylyltransferase